MRRARESSRSQRLLCRRAARSARTTSGRRSRRRRVSLQPGPTAQGGRRHRLVAGLRRSGAPRWSTRRCATTSTSRSPRRASTHSSVRYVTTRSALFPQVAISPGFPVQAADSAARDQSTLLSRSPDSVDTEYSTFYQAALSASWEIDLWGKVRRQDRVRARRRSSRARKRAAASCCRWRRMRPAATSRCAISIAGCRSRTRPRARASIRSSCSASASPAASSRRSRSRRRNRSTRRAVAAIPNYEAQIAQQETALSLLLGRNPGPIARGKTIDELTPDSRFLRVCRRAARAPARHAPGRAAADRRQCADRCREGAVFSVDIADGRCSGAASTSLVESVHGARTNVDRTPRRSTAPIFNAGADRRAGAAGGSGASSRRSSIYDKTIQAAFGDVEDALIEAQKIARDPRCAANAQVAALAEYARLARLRYDNGYTSYIEVLDAERSLFEAQIELRASAGRRAGVADRESTRRWAVAGSTLRRRCRACSRCRPRNDGGRRLPGR